MKFATRMALVLFAVGAFQTASAKTIEIKMLNAGKEGTMVFEPGFTTAAVGDTLKFVAVDKAHNTASILVPAGAKEWKGKPDEAVVVKLTKEGVYLFQCEPHAVMAMVGVVQVGKPTNLDAAKAEATKRSAAFVMNKDRFGKYLDQVK